MNLKQNTKLRHQTTREKKRRTEEHKNSQKIISKMATTIYLPIITIKVNRLHLPIKRHRDRIDLKK